MKRVLCVAAHPDDEILGCGATLAAHAQNGDEVEVIIVAEGLTSRDQKRDPSSKSSEFSELYKAADHANKSIGVKKLHLLSFPDNRMDGVELLDIVKKIEEIVSIFKPEIVYTHFAGDLNVDHKIVCQATLTACRPLPSAPVKKILAFEVPSATHWDAGTPETNFRADYFINVESTIAKKLAALEIYRSEMRAFPHARSIEAVKALATWRGASVGYLAAESFQVLRILQD